MPRLLRPGRRLVAGVDGCPGGWVVARLPEAGRAAAEVTVVPSFAAVLALDAVVVAVDIPIGLADASARACDVHARAGLGPRRSSVFPAPVRSVLGSPDYAGALARSRAARGVGLSKQTWNLVPKIADVDACMSPALQTRVVECHPESSFAALAGAPLASTKITAAGIAARVALLAPYVTNVEDLLDSRPRGARADDVLDSLAAAWTARRVVAGEARRLGDGSRDRRGLVMEIAV